MATVHDVASYILSKRSPITAMKLQKLVYYCQAWSLVWDEEPLFPEAVEAWANGPVVRELYEKHRGLFKIHRWDGNPDALSKKQRETIDAVLKYYGGLSSQELSNLTHREEPWKNAREGLGPGDRGFRVISPASMVEYYSSLV